jgi:uncharacterized protein YjbI with pentapeptide repeats
MVMKNGQIRLLVLLQFCTLEQRALAADFAGADLSGAHLTNADLRGSNLSGANLTGANLSGTDLRVHPKSFAALAKLSDHQSNRCPA